MYQCHYLHRAQSLLWWHVPSVPVYQCHYLHRAQSLLWWHVPSVPVSLFTPCIESVVVTCTQCTSVTIYTVHRVCCGDMYPVYQCTSVTIHTVHRVCCGDMYPVYQCTSVTIYTVHRVCCGDMYPVYQCHYSHRAQSLLWWHVPSVPVSLFTPCTESVVVTCTQCTSVTIHTVHRVCCGDMYPVYQCICCGDMYPVYQCHYSHRAQSLLWWHVPSVPVSLFTPCTESVVVTCTQCTSVAIYTVHRVCCGVMYPVYQCHYLHWSQSLLWWHVPSVPVSLFTPCTESVVVTCTQCTSVTIHTVHRVCCGDMYPVYQCHYLHRAQSLLWWHVPCVPVSLFTLCTESVVVTCTQCTSVPVSLFTPCTESVVVTCSQCTSVPVSLFTPCTESVVVTCTQCTSVTIHTVHRVCCGDMYPVYQCHYLHRAQSLLWWHVPCVPVSLFTPCTESVVVTCTQCTSVTIYTVHRVCCGDMYPVYQCHYLHCAQSLLWWHVPSVPVYQCHYSHRAQSLLWWHVPSVPVSLFTPCTESVVVTCTQCTSVTIHTVHRVCCGDMYPVYQCHYSHRAQSLLWWHVPSVPVSLFTPCTESVVVTCTLCTSVTIHTVHRVCCGDMYPVYKCTCACTCVTSLKWRHVTCTTTDLVHSVNSNTGICHSSPPSCPLHSSVSVTITCIIICWLKLFFICTCTCVFICKWT